MYRIVIVAVATVLLGIAVQRALIAENGATADKPAAVKSDRQKDRRDAAGRLARPPRHQDTAGQVITDRDTVQQPPAKADRKEVTGPAVKPPDEAKQPAAKADREEKKPPVATVTPAPRNLRQRRNARRKSPRPPKSSARRRSRRLPP